MSAETPEPARLTDDEREAIAARDAEHAARLAAVEAERDGARGALAAAPEVLRLAEISDQIGVWMTRAEKAEAERDRLRATLDAVETRADWRAMPGLGVDRMIPASDLRAVLDQHPGPDDTREGA